MGQEHEMKGKDTGKTHTRCAAECLLHLLRKTVSEDASLIGSFGRGAETSEHDIDVLVPGARRTVRLRNKITHLLDADRVTDTDWGGWYFHDTFYGDVDVFFSTKDFDR